MKSLTNHSRILRVPSRADLIASRPVIAALHGINTGEPAFAASSANGVKDTSRGVLINPPQTEASFVFARTTVLAGRMLPRKPNVPRQPGVKGAYLSPPEAFR